jgi:hypothetical protein
MVTGLLWTIAGLALAIVLSIIGVVAAIMWLAQHWRG